MQQLAGKPTTYWAINKNGMIQADTISLTRKGAIEIFLKDCSVSWSECNKIYGYKAMKVVVTISVK
jgi:hypothetical protein